MFTRATALRGRRSMTNRWFARILASGAGMWLALAGHAVAQEHTGNAMNPGGTPLLVERDPDGSGISEHSRTPTGFRLAPPPRGKARSGTREGWMSTFRVDFGGIGTSGDANNAKFREYKDWASGAYVDTFGLGLEHSSGRGFLEVRGGGVGRDD